MTGGLLPTPRSRKDFALTVAFGAPSLDLPDEYDLGQVRKPVKQGQNLCTSEALAEDASDEFGVEMDSSWQAGKISLCCGWPIWRQGANMRKAMDSGRIFGYLPKSNSPFSHDKEGDAFVCAWENWPRTLDETASQFKRKAYFNILQKSLYQPFDAVRTALYAHGNRALIGMPWYASFDTKGLITTIAGPYTWHAVTVKGWVVKKGKPHMKVRSWSGSKGDNSYYYFPEEIWNKCLNMEGAVAYMYLDADDTTIESMRQLTGGIQEIILDLMSQLVIKLRYGMA